MSVTVTLKAPEDLLGPLQVIVTDDPLVSLHAAAIECLRLGVETLSADPHRLMALVRSEKARQRARHLRSK